MTTKIDPLESWHALQAVIHGMTEKDLEEQINKELEGKKRRNMVLRMHMKLNKLRYAREKKVYTSKTVMVRTGRSS